MKIHHPDKGWTPRADRRGEDVWERPTGKDHLDAMATDRYQCRLAMSTLGHWFQVDSPDSTWREVLRMFLPPPPLTPCVRPPNCVTMHGMSKRSRFLQLKIPCSMMGLATTIGMDKILQQLRIDEL